VRGCAFNGRSLFLRPGDRSTCWRRATCW
jgi:hypothetical protein